MKKCMEVEKVGSHDRWKQFTIKPGEIAKKSISRINNVLNIQTSGCHV